MADAAYHINEVLAEITRAGDQAFQIEFVKATGKEQGELRQALAYYGAPNPKDRQAPTAAQRGRGQRKLYVDAGTIPLTEAGTRRMLTPLISHITGFQGRKVYH